MPGSGRFLPLIVAERQDLDRLNSKTFLNFVALIISPRFFQLYLEQVHKKNSRVELYAVKSS